MVKLYDRPRFLPSAPNPGFVKLVFSFDKRINEAIKAFPGVHWGPMYDREAAWFVPWELQPEVAAAVAAIAGPHARPVPLAAPTPARPRPYHPDARSWQTEFQDFTDRWHGGGAWFEQGLGKSLAVLMARVGRTVIVTPAGTVETMFEQIKTWAPDASVARFDVATKKKWSDDLPDILLTTYSCLGDARLTSGVCQWGTIIFDEAHRIKNHKTKQAKAARVLRSAFPRARIYLATGTPQGEGFVEWFNYVDMIWPGRFGNFKKFTDRYARREVIEIPDMPEEDRPTKIVGLRDEFAEEFKRRIALTGVRAVKADLPPGSLPAMNVIPFWCPQPIAAQRGALARLLEGDPNDEIFLQHMKLASVHKIKPTLEAIMDLVDEGHPRIFVAGWFVGFVEAIGAGLAELLGPESEYEIIVTHGGGKSRAEALPRANAAKKAILIATIASVSEGINALAQWPQAIIGEVHYSPIMMSQLFARLHRLNTAAAVTLRVMLLRDSLDDRIIERLSGKVEEQNKLIKLGLFEESWQKTIVPSEGQTDDGSWRAELSKIAALTEEDEDKWF